MSYCNGCGAGWGGLRTSHCAACHTSFTCASAFDRHRTGSHATGRRCLLPENVGLVLADRAYECWGWPGEA